MKSHYEGYFDGNPDLVCVCKLGIIVLVFG
jgi:hypothetical protein